mgnify:CR=1 FL=1
MPANAAYSWTGLGLPNYPEKGFTETRGVNILRTPTDMGPGKQRKRSNRPNTLQVQYTLTKAQVSTLDTFLTTTIGGVNRFNYPHPRLSTGATYTLVEVRVVPQSDGQLFSIQHITTDYYKVGLTLEVLP